ncbi:MAG: leucyl/phenylalanyl-tRNA--protein transferase, partial [Bacteroidales bacterium]
MQTINLDTDSLIQAARDIFPAHDTADDDGFLIAGGDLTPEILLIAYTYGIFPWFSEGSPVLWWSPPERMMLIPEQLKVSKSLKQVIREKKFTVTFDKAFDKVIRHCAYTKRPDQQGTWITNEMIEAYSRLHELGFAHSVESWLDGKLSGGLYGISIGKAFFGESMFYHETNASKVAFYHLVEKVKSMGFHFIDAQLPTPHLESLGAINIPRDEFLDLLNRAVRSSTHTGNWG